MTWGAAAGWMIPSPVTDRSFGVCAVTTRSQRDARPPTNASSKLSRRRSNGGELTARRGSSRYMIDLSRHQTLGRESATGTHRIACVSVARLRSADKLRAAA